MSMMLSVEGLPCMYSRWVLASLARLVKSVLVLPRIAKRVCSALFVAQVSPRLGIPQCLVTSLCRTPLGMLWAVGEFFGAAMLLGCGGAVLFEAGLGLSGGGLAFPWRLSGGSVSCCVFLGRLFLRFLGLGGTSFPISVTLRLTRLPGLTRGFLTLR